MSIHFGVLASFLSPIIALFLIYALFRPKVAISDCIAWSGSDGYDIKVLNKSRLFSLVHVECDCYVVTLEQISGGDLQIFRPLTLKFRKIPCLSRFSTTTDHENYAWRFEIQDDVRELANQRAYLHCKVLAQSALSNIVGSFDKTYELPSSVREGVFPYGPSLEVVKAASSSTTQESPS